MTAENLVTLGRDDEAITWYETLTKDSDDSFTASARTSFSHTVLLAREPVKIVWFALSRSSLGPL